MPYSAVTAEILPKRKAAHVEMTGTTTGVAAARAFARYRIRRMVFIGVPRAVLDDRARRGVAGLTGGADGGHRADVDVYATSTVTMYTCALTPIKPTHPGGVRRAHLCQRATAPDRGEREARSGIRACRTADSRSAPVRTRGPRAAEAWV